MAREVDMTRVAFSARLDAGGKLHPVGGIIRTLLAAADETAKAGGLSGVRASHNGERIGEPLLDPRRWPLHDIQADPLGAALERPDHEHGPRGAWRRRQEEECARLRLLNRDVPLELGGTGLYQELPLLHQVERERLPREERTGREGRAAGTDEGDQRG